MRYRFGQVMYHIMAFSVFRILVELNGASNVYYLEAVSMEQYKHEKKIECKKIKRNFFFVLRFFEIPSHAI